MIEAWLDNQIIFGGFTVFVYLGSLLAAWLLLGSAMYDLTTPMPKSKKRQRRAPRLLIIIPAANHSTSAVMAAVRRLPLKGHQLEVAILAEKKRTNLKKRLQAYKKQRRTRSIRLFELMPINKTGIMQVSQRIKTAEYALVLQPNVHFESETFQRLLEFIRTHKIDRPLRLTLSLPFTAGFFATSQISAHYLQLMLQQANLMVPGNTLRENTLYPAEQTRAGKFARPYTVRHLALQQTSSTRKPSPLNTALRTITLAAGLYAISLAISQRTSWPLLYSWLYLLCLASLALRAAPYSRQEKRLLRIALPSLPIFTASNWLSSAWLRLRQLY